MIPFTDPPDPAIPYYRLRAPSILDTARQLRLLQDLALGDWVLTGWRSEPAGAATLEGIRSDTCYTEFDSSTVVFNQGNATITAEYKAHLMGITPGSSPTKGNNQRKVAIDSAGCYHAVYQSSGEIWHITTSDWGAHWSRETRLSDGSGTAKNPCISIFNGYPLRFIYVSFFQDGAVVLKTRRIDFDPFNPQCPRIYYPWQSKMSVPVSNADCTPVVESMRYPCDGDWSNATAVVLWDDTDSLRYTTLARDSIVWLNRAVRDLNPRGTYSWHHPRYPSISKELDFSWNDWGKAWMMRMNHDLAHCPATGTIVFDTLGLTGNNFPVTSSPTSIACGSHGTNTTIAMEPLNIVYPNLLTFGILMHPPYPPGYFPTFFPSQSKTIELMTVSSNSVRRGKWYTPSTVLVWPNWVGGTGTSSLSPNASLFDQSLSPIVVAYNDGIQGVGIVRFDAVGHNPKLFVQTDGVDPNLVPMPSQGSNFDVYSLPYTTPFTHRVDGSTSSTINKTLTDDYDMIRELTVLYDTAAARIGIMSPIHTNGSEDEALQMFAGPDTTQIGVDVTLEEKMRSASFVIRDSSMVAFGFGTFVYAPERFSENSAFVLQIIAEGNGAVLWSNSMPFSEICRDSVSIAAVEADLSPYAGTTAYLTIGLVNSDSVSYALRDLFFMQDGIGKTGLPGRGNRRAPSSITLNQNSPNPFSTSTEISFSLRETSDVTVVVSDLLGRIIRTIDLGTRSAGAHAFRFVPENLRTGVYLYRVASGGHSVARKMILVR